MYFLAHTYSLLQALPKGLSREKIIEPMLLGSWCPDAGYFPFFSWQLRIFDHFDEPPVNFYQKGSIEAQAFRLGWKCHLLCDDLIHNGSFFSSQEPLCPPIIKGRGLWMQLVSFRKHLIREIGLDFLIFQQLSENDRWLTTIIKAKETYKRQSFPIQGFQFFQSYIYRYINSFLPFLQRADPVPKFLLKAIDFDFYSRPFVLQKTKELLANAEKACREIIAKELTVKLAD